MKAAGVFAILAIGIAGCIEAPQAPISTVQPPAPASTVPSTAFGADQAVNAPTWNIGTWFGHHVFFGAEDTEGEHYNTIVVSRNETAYLLASDDDEAARQEAAFDIPILGAIGREHLKTTGLGGEWDFFRFPMKDGLTWDSVLRIAPQGTEEVFDITHVAAYSPAINTPYGPRPGFKITGTVDGQPFLAYDYVPDLGWYAHLFVYNILTDEEGDFVFHSMSMGRGEGWTGEYYLYEGKTLLELFGGAAVSTSVPPEAYLEPQPYATFTMDESSTLLYGFLVAVAVAGAHEIILLDPDGTAHEVRAIGAPADVQGGDLALPAVGGDWSLLSLGAGAAWFEVAFLWQLTAQHGTL
jgi:hypothetical protein